MPTPTQALKLNSSAGVSSYNFVLATQGGATTGPGKSLVAHISCTTKTRTISSVTDNAGNTNWAQLSGGGSGSEGSSFLWYCSNAQPITDFTVTLSGTSSIQIGFLEVDFRGGVGDTSQYFPHTVAATTAVQTLTNTYQLCFCLAAFAAVTAPTGISGSTLGWSRATGAEAGGSGLQQGLAYADADSMFSDTVTWSSVSQISSTNVADVRVLFVPPTLVNTVKRPVPVIRAASY